MTWQDVRYYIQGDRDRYEEVEARLKEKYPNQIGYETYCFDNPVYYYTCADGVNIIKVERELKSLLDNSNYTELKLESKVEIPKFEKSVMYRAIMRNCRAPFQIYYVGSLYSSIEEMMTKVTPDKQDGDIFIGYKEEECWKVINRYSKNEINIYNIDKHMICL